MLQFYKVPISALWAQATWNEKPTNGLQWESNAELKTKL